MADMGILAMALSISVPIQIATVAVEKAFTPTILKRISINDDRLIIKKILEPFVSVILINLVLSLACLALVSWIGPYVIDEKYSDSFPLIFWIIIGIFMQSVNSNIITIYSKLRKGKLLSKLAILHFFNHTVIALAFIYTLGIQGAAVGYMVSYVIAAFINGLFIRGDLSRAYSNAL